MDKLLLIDDEPDVQYSFRRTLDPAEIELVTASSGEEGVRLFSKVKPDVILMDVRMGGMSGLDTLHRLREMDARIPVIMMTAYGTTQTAIEAMKLGAYDYLLKPFDVPKLRALIANALSTARAMKQVVSFEPLLESEDYAAGIVGRSEAMQNVFKLVGQLATSDATALVTGESGTGKELVARAIYHHSKRHDRPFLAINCAALPENLLEAELFGHEKGAFTGAVAQRLGKFEQCNHGTIFLDEIGDMSLTTQTKILRVLQDGTFERVGGNQVVRVDVRIIAATNKPLEKAVAAREFRKDLFYRLNVVRIQIPPLRDRPEDIPLLVNYFLKKIAQGSGQEPKNIAPQASAALERFSWPGNVRELENVIRRALVVAKGSCLLLQDLPREYAANLPSTLGEGGRDARSAAETAPKADELSRSACGGADVASLARALFQWARQDSKCKLIPTVERELVVNALEETHGNQVQAARLLGITRATLRKRIAKFRIKQELSVHRHVS